MKTRYFTFGQSHIHRYKNHILDKDCVVRISAEDPRSVMFDNFEDVWAFEYEDMPDMSLFCRGIYDLTNNKWEN